jgi:hypothetical protein
MAVMTESAYEVVPIQRDRRACRPAPVVRICSDTPLGAQLLLPAESGTPSIAPLLPIQRDRKGRRVRRGSSRRLAVLAVALGMALAVWVAIIGAVVTLAPRL